MAVILSRSEGKEPSACLNCLRVVDLIISWSYSMFGALSQLARPTNQRHGLCETTDLDWPSIVIVMMILHQMRHGRQDNHATNHVRCTKRARQGKTGGISRPSKAKTYTSQTCGVQRLPSKALEKHPVNAHGGSTTARHGRKGNWIRTDKKGWSGPTSSQPLDGVGCHLGNGVR
jgi:hypothetical protein